MKVEKCPRCGTATHVMQTDAIKMYRIFFKRFQFNCQSVYPEDDCAWMEIWAVTKFDAILRYNRWASREARRTAKEGATK